MGLRKKLEEIRNRPYQERVKLLWTMITGAAIIILIIWFFTIKFRNMPETEGVSRFDNIINSFKEFNVKLKDQNAK